MTNPLKEALRRRASKPRQAPRLGLSDYLKLWRIWKDPVMIEKLRSRKLWAAVVGGAFVTVGQYLGVPQAFTQHIVELVMVYIAGQSVVDAAGAVKAKRPE